MGDDDLFIKNKLEKFIKFVKSNSQFKYFLRSYLTIHQDGTEEIFQYLPKSKILPKGLETVAWLFKRSVSLSGFTISRNDALYYTTNKLDGTLLYQVYLMSQICMHNESIYCEIPFAHAVQSFRQNKPMFGSSEAERKKYTPGSVTLSNSLNFIKSYFEVTKYFDDKHNTNLTSMVLKSLSKYSYPILSIQRKKGVSEFLKYTATLKKELNFDISIYFFIYKWSLIILGEKKCDKIIIFIKRLIGHTPNL